MSAEQKRAWLVLIVTIVSVGGYVVLVPFVGAWAAFTFGLYFLLLFLPLVGRKQPADERDKSIARRGTMAGGLASYLAFVLGCMGTWWVAFAWKGQEQVSVHTMGIIACLGALVFWSVRSIVILVLYGRHVEADDA